MAVLFVRKLRFQFGHTRFGLRFAFAEGRQFVFQLRQPLGQSKFFAFEFVNPFLALQNRLRQAVDPFVLIALFAFQSLNSAYAFLCLVVQRVDELLGFPLTGFRGLELAGQAFLFCFQLRALHAQFGEVAPGLVEFAAQRRDLVGIVVVPRFQIRYAVLQFSALGCQRRVHSFEFAKRLVALGNVLCERIDTGERLIFARQNRVEFTLQPRDLSLQFFAGRLEIFQRLARFA